MGVQISSRGAVGAAEIIEIVSGDAKPSDQFLLASDGLTELFATTNWQRSFVLVRLRRRLTI
jgi:serine/threonine protein phosphatase PrpC